MAVVERRLKNGKKVYYAAVRQGSRVIYKHCGGSKRLAAEVSAQYSVAARNNRLPTMRDIKFSALTDKFFADGCHGRRGQTIAAYQSRAKNHLTPFFDDIRVRQGVTVERLHQWVGWMRERSCSDATTRSAATTLSAILSYGVDINLITDNPSRRLRLSRVTTGGVDYILSPAEVQSLIRSTPERNGDRYLLAFLALTGCRPSEGTEIRWRDIAFTRNEVVISRTATKSADKTNPTKTGKGLVVPLTPTLAKMLGDWKRKINGSGDDLVFPAVRGGRRDPQRFAADAFRPSLTRAGLAVPDGSRSLYLLRKSLASNLLNAGESIKLVSTMLGQSEAVCLRHYARVRTEDTSAAMHRFDAMMTAHDRDAESEVA